MAQLLITQQVGPVTNQALGILHWQTVFPRLLTRDIGVSGSLAVGATVNVPVPATLLAKKFDRATGIVTQPITERTIPVKLEDVYDVSVELTDEEVTLDLTEFGRQVTRPAMLAIARQMEQLCVDLLQTGGSPVHPIEPTPAGSVRSFIDATAILNQQEVPLSGRYAVVGTSLAATLKNSDHLLPVDASGSTGVLRDATIGRLAGCEVIENPHVPFDEGFLFAEDAAVFVTRALTTLGTSQVSSGALESVAIRTLIDHDIRFKNVVASWDTLCGGSILDDRRLIPLKLDV